MGGKKTKKKIGDFSSVSARYFLEKICGVSSENAETMNHNAIRELLPSLKRTSYAHVLKNPELVATREVIIVEDYEHQVIPYVVPEIIEPFSEDSFTKQEKILNEILRAFSIVMELSETATLVIECNSSLNKYIVKPKKIASGLDGAELASKLLEANYIHNGVMINSDGNVYNYEHLAKDSNIDETNFLIEVTATTDSVVVTADANKDIAVILLGNRYPELDLSLLRAELSVHFDFVKNKEKAGEVEIDGYRLATMSNYDLEELMRYFKKANQLAYYHRAKRELLQRTAPNKFHKKEKEKQKIKDYGDEILNDKYKRE